MNTKVKTSEQKGTTPKITIREDWCKGCEFCVIFCPQDVLRMEGALPVVVDATKCTRCPMCVVVCPDFAIKVE
jgi:2-oxoglutarate ferredoxin oxidoreductase subunit delta